MDTPSAHELETLLLRVVELLARAVDSLERIEQQQERTNALLDRIDKTQWS